jgi:hypothetical protein
VSTVTIVDRRRAVEGLAIALLLATAAVVLGASWQRWLDPIVDAGRDLYIPEQLRHGALLYRDLKYVYPPLGPYLLAGITALIGSSLAAYTAIGLAIAAATAALLYGIARQTAGVAAAFAAALLFVSCSLAGASTFGCNYLFPYSHAATIGMLLALAAVASALARRPALLVVFATLAAWTKLEMFVVATAIVCAAWLAGRVSARTAGAYAGAIVATAAVARLIFGAALWVGVFPPSLLGGGSARFFYSRVSGSGEWRANLAASVAGALLVCAFAALLALMHRSRRPVLVALLGVALVPVAFTISGESFFRAWSLLQLALLPLAWRSRAREPLFVLLAASLASTSRVFLNLTPEWYGFVHAVPLFVLIAYVLFGWMPARACYSRRLALLWLIPIVAIAAQEVRLERAAYALKTHRVDTVRGTFFDANGDRAAILNEALPLLAGRSLAVLPEGVAIDYFAGVVTPLPFYVFTPPEIGDDLSDRAVAAALVARAPERVALVTRDLTEFGSRGLGVDYGLAVMRTLRERYVLERQWRAPRFTLVLLRLRR